MANVIIPQRFWTRRGTADALTAANEVLYSGEWCLETDTGRAKYGDGVTAWNDLLYSLPGRMDLSGLSDGNAILWSASGGYWYVGDPDVNQLSGFPGGTTNFLRADGTFAPSGGAAVRGYASGRLRTGAATGLSDSGGTPTTNSSTSSRQTYQPFSVERTITIATLYVDINTAQATALFRLGIYDTDSSGSLDVPGNLLGQTADLSGASTGLVGGAPSPSIVLSPGSVYWASFAPTAGANANFRCFPVGNFPPAWLGRATPNTAAPYNHLYTTGAITSLPATYPGSGTLQAANVPAILFTE